MADHSRAGDACLQARLDAEPGERGLHEHRLAALDRNARA